MIANCDRNFTNLKVNRAGAPTKVYIFDHERSLFHLMPDEGIARLKAVEGRLGLTDASDSQGDEWHCLIEFIDSEDSISKWLTRIEDIPDWFIDDVCKDVRRINISPKECRAVTEFLKRRRDGLEALILKHKHRFPKIKQGLIAFR